MNLTLSQTIRRGAALAAAIALCAGPAAQPRMASAATAPPFIKVGTLYASSGAYAAISQPIYKGLTLEIEALNAGGGVFVKPYNKKIPIKLISYDDQSSTATAATLYNQLITQDKVDILIADAGSVLTSVAVPIAKEHQMLLFNQSGTGAALFTADNPYNVLLGDPVSNLWPRNFADFLKSQAKRLGIKRVAMVYATNDFTGSQAAGFREFLKGSDLQLVFDEGVATTTTSYSVTINAIRAANPDFVLELGYTGNDAAFLRDLSASGVKFKGVFAIYPGLEGEQLMKTVGERGLDYVYTYAPGNIAAHAPNFGMDASAFKSAWQKKFGDLSQYGFNAIAGYQTALILEKTLGTTSAMDQLSLRKAVFALSGRLRTLDGEFELRADGAQVGEVTPIAQIQPAGAGTKYVIVYPERDANGKAIYPAP